jgi:hypothetical protein
MFSSYRVVNKTVNNNNNNNNYYYYYYVQFVSRSKHNHNQSLCRPATCLMFIYTVPCLTKRVKYWQRNYQNCIKNSTNANCFLLPKTAQYLPKVNTNYKIPGAFKVRTVTWLQFAVIICFPFSVSLPNPLWEAAIYSWMYVLDTLQNSLHLV